MYFKAEALREAGVVVGVDNVLCGNCLGWHSQLVSNGRDKKNRNVAN